MSILDKARFLGYKPDSMCMQEGEIASRFHEGFYSEALIIQVSPLLAGTNKKQFNVAVKGRGYWTYASSARDVDTPKAYKSLDAAMSAIEKIGFRDAHIELNKTK